MELIPNQLMFLIFSLVLRAVQGIGEAATLSSACALLTIEFGQGSVATTFVSQLSIPIQTILTLKYTYTIF